MADGEGAWAWLGDLVGDLKARGERAYRRADRLTGGRLGIVRDAAEGFGEARGSEAAASMAYYTLFSLFPLLLALVAAGSHFLDRQQIFREVVDLVSETFPISQDLIEENLQQVLALRGAVGLTGLVAVLWSASGAFTVLTRNINRAWSKAPPRGFVRNRLVALGMVGSVVLLLVVSLVLSTGLNVLSALEIPMVNLESLYGTALWTVISDLVPGFFAFLLFVALYRWVPNREVGWPDALWAALVVAIAWQIVANAFAWYVGSGLARYRLVYGSLGAVVALMFWLYLGSWIIIFGAHLSAAIGRHRWDEAAT
ncbi:MAG: YihY/virulence factor BrkB family protein [Anaerolineae bacterium]